MEAGEYCGRKIHEKDIREDLIFRLYLFEEIHSWIFRISENMILIF